MGSVCDGFQQDRETQLPFSDSINGQKLQKSTNRYFLERFSLFKTPSNFYLVGRDKSKKIWRVLKIDRSEPLKLVIYEDPFEYSWGECYSLLQNIDDGNRHVGGRKFVSICYGVVGFIKFMGPYYMLLITNRRQIGKLCGHPIYAISKRRLIRIPHKSALSKVKLHTDENRYKRLLCTVDFTKEFYFSHSYQLMHSLQQNLCSYESASSMPYGSIFVWNDFLTQEIRERLGNSLWTVALVHGFFKQVELSASERNFSFTLIARRSRLHAGTRYLTRGLNEVGQAANDVEVEQIVCGAFGNSSYRISSTVQDRGSIPLFWVQPASWINLKPEILLIDKDDNYEATKLHFEELCNRYGKPIYILNLVKSGEKKPRESVLGDEFHKAVALINEGLPVEKQLNFISMDLDGVFQSEGTLVFDRLNEVLAEALDDIGFLSYEIGLQRAQVDPQRTLNMSSSWELNGDAGNLETSAGSAKEIKESEGKESNSLCKHHFVKALSIQNGVLRTNCVDCLDRTNVAQFVYGFLALGHQLYAVGITKELEVDRRDDSLFYGLMEVYKEMGDALAWQYGGSAARCKIFSEKRGEWRPAIQLQEAVKTLQRYVSNAYMDIDKQKAINLLLGNLRPEGSVLSDENLIHSSSLNPDKGKHYCFLCEGMSYQTPESSGDIKPATADWEVFLGPSTSETAGSKEASSSAVTSGSDILDNRFASAMSESQLEALTEFEESLWFGSPRSCFSDGQDEQRV